MDGAMWRLADTQIWLASKAKVYGVDSHGAPIGDESA